jgi:hypothetical protein
MSGADNWDSKTREGINMYKTRRIYQNKPDLVIIRSESNEKIDISKMSCGLDHSLLLLSE